MRSMSEENTNVCMLVKVFSFFYDITLGAFHKKSIKYGKQNVHSF